MRQKERQNHFLEPRITIKKTTCAERERDRESERQVERETERVREREENETVRLTELLFRADNYDNEDDLC